MNTYIVTVRTLDGAMTYPAIGTDSGAVHMAALDQFGACGVTVKPA
jgi:ADP-heptose:LPS heptosyltransferase